MLAHRLMTSQLLILFLVFETEYLYVVLVVMSNVLEFTETCLSLPPPTPSAGIKGMYQHT